MKPWEETWHLASDGEVEDQIVANESGWVARFFRWVTEPAEVVCARARLAACAPEMARLLLEAEFAQHPYGEPENGYCPWCEGRSEPGAHGMTYGMAGVHRDDCPWLALMKKAGIR